MKKSSAQIAYERQGFSLVNTGGNCTAYHKPISGNRHLLVTRYGEAEAPEEAAEPVFVGLYNDGEAESIDGFHSPDSDAVATKLGWKGWE